MYPLNKSIIHRLIFSVLLLVVFKISADSEFTPQPEDFGDNICTSSDDGTAVLLENQVVSGGLVTCADHDGVEVASTVQVHDTGELRIVAPRVHLKPGFRVGAGGKLEVFAERLPTISGTPAGSVNVDEEYIFTPNAGDADGDKLVFSIQNQPPWADFDSATGALNGTPSATGRHLDIVISVSDGKAIVSLAAFSIDVTPNAVEDALQSGEVSEVTSGELLDALLEEIEAGRSLLMDAKIEIFNLNPDGTAKVDGTSLTSISWDPTHDAARLESVFGMTTSFLLTNDVTNPDKGIQEKEIGIIGNSPSRFMVLGSNPMRNDYRFGSVNESMHQLLQNSIAWLTGRDDLNATGFSVVIAHMDDGYWFPDETAVRYWLDSRYGETVSYNSPGACDDANLPVCLAAGPDLLIISQVGGADPEAVGSAVQSGMENGTPVLYLHHDGNLSSLGRELFSLFNVVYEGDNYWSKLQLTEYDITDHPPSPPSNVVAIQIMLEHFKAEDYAFDWSVCSGNSCSEVVGLDTQFQQGADAVRALMTNFDKQKIDLFSGIQYRFQKLLVLLGDKYRQSVRFPMDKAATDDTTFLKSLFSDHAVYNYRSINPVQPDMGNFSRSDFNHVTPIARTVDLESKVRFRSAGVYALPGQTVQVSRLDNSNLTVKVFINTQRSGSTQQYKDYNRPKFLKSEEMEIRPGETIRFTSPYGGPLQVSFSENDLPVQLKFENVGEHPYWRGSQDDFSFADKLATGDYDWAELATPAFEVHSQLEKMRDSVSEWGSAANLAATTVRYTYNFPHVLAGFKGPGIDVVPEIHDFADNNGWNINNLDKVKHMNADQATCGYGCSGNPYDAFWNFSPLGHGDLHELGHGLERHRFRFHGWEGHAVTNPYSYYSKSHFNSDMGSNSTACQSLPFQSVFNALQASIGQADPVAYLQTNLWGQSNWSHQVSMTIQMMMTAEAEGVLQNGWHLLARLHMLDREFNRADDNETDWLAKRDSLGFSSYAHAEAKDVSNNDWLLIAFSYVTGLDFRDYISTWGHLFSDKADAQVESFSYPKAPIRYFISNSCEYCEWNDDGDFLNKPSLPIDGAQVWP